MSLAASDDPVRALERFSGRQGVVAGYIMDEVLRNLDPGTAYLLRCTSILDRMCGPLAEALTKVPGAASQLVNLERQNIFVVESEDGEWFRYHPLMRDTLRAQLHADSPGLEKELHRRAALWFETRGEWLYALDHALAAEDPDLVAGVTLRSAAVCIFTSQRSELGALLERLPLRVTHNRVDLQMARTLGAFCRADHTAEAVLLEAVEAGLDTLPQPVQTLTILNICVLRAAAAHRAGDAAAMTVAANRAALVQRGLTVEAAPGWAAIRGTVDALAAIGELWSGNPRRAQELMGRARVQARTADIDDYRLVSYGGTNALAEHSLGRIASTRALAQEVSRRARLSGGDMRHEARFAHVALAAAEVQRGDAEAAGAAVDAGQIAVARGDDPFTREALRVVAATLRLLLDDLSGARLQLARIPRFADTWPRMALVTRQHAALDVEVELAAGAVDRAQAVLERFDVVSGGVAGGPLSTEPDPVAIARARVLLARGLADKVRGALDIQLSSEGVLGVEAWLTVAVADEHLRREARAVTALSRAIELAAADEVRLPFLRRRDRLDALLQRHLDLVGSHRAFVSSLLRARTGGILPVSSPDLRIDPLTARELSVLIYLPSMSSNEEIARALGISVNTVKQHLKSINRKLGVGTRRDAVRVARAASLLP